MTWTDGRGDVQSAIAKEMLVHLPILKIEMRISIESGIGIDLFKRCGGVKAARPKLSAIKIIK